MGKDWIFMDGFFALWALVLSVRACTFNLIHALLVIVRVCERERGERKRREIGPDLMMNGSSNKMSRGMFVLLHSISL